MALVAVYFATGPLVEVAHSEPADPLHIWVICASQTERVTTPPVTYHCPPPSIVTLAPISPAAPPSGAKPCPPPDKRGPPLPYS